MSTSDFFKGSNGQLSSKRLILISSAAFCLYETHKICAALIKSCDSSGIVDLMFYFYLYVAILGGYVSIEGVASIVGTIKGKFIPQLKEIKNVPNDPKLDS